MLGLSAALIAYQKFMASLYQHHFCSNTTYNTLMTECVFLAFYVYECLSVIVKGIRTEEKSLEQMLKSSKRDEI